MKLSYLVDYVHNDLRARRGRFELSLGVLSIGMGMAALLLVATTTHGVHRFVDLCFFYAKPVIGTAHITEKFGDHIPTAHYQEMQQLVAETRDVESICWIVNDLYNLPIRKSKDEEFPSELPLIWATPAQSPLFDHANGFRYVSPLKNGGPLFDQPSDELRFEIVLTMRYLEDFLSFKEEEIEDIVIRGKLDKVPKEVFFHHTPIPAWPTPFEPGTVALPVTGICTWRDRSFPHLFVSFDVACAYHYDASSDWNAGYPLHFCDGQGNQLVKESDVLNSSRQLDTERLTALPAKRKLLEAAQFGDRNITPYRKAVLFVRDYRSPSVRAMIKKRIEAPKLCYATPATRQAIEDLDERRVRLVSDWLRSSAPEAAGPLVAATTRVNVRIESPGTAWELVDREGGQVFLVAKRGENLEVSRESPWVVSLPSDTATKTLNHVSQIVDFYSWICSIVVVLLTSAVSLIAGLGYVYRKRQDIGLLKACGMMPWSVGLLYAVQVWLISCAGILAGIGLMSVVGLILEPAANSMIAGLNTGFVFDRPLIQLTAGDIVTTSGWIMLGTAVGTATAFLRVLTLNPVEDLATGA